VAEKLGLDRSTAQRRLHGARERGYITNQEERRYRPARYVIGDAMPEELDLLPHSRTPPGYEPAGHDGVCSCAGGARGNGREHAPGCSAVTQDAP